MSWDRRRWPGWDGWLLLGLDALVLVLAAVRQLEGFEGPALAGVGATAAAT